MKTERIQKVISCINKVVKTEDAVGTIELILILAVIIGLVLIFKKQLTQLVNDLFAKITREAKSV